MKTLNEKYGKSVMIYINHTGGFDDFNQYNGNVNDRWDLLMHFSDSY